MSPADVVGFSFLAGVVLALIAAHNVLVQGSRLSTCLFILGSQVWLACAAIVYALPHTCK